MFQPLFHQAIRTGTKRSTIRLKARCKPGDDLSLRAWTGKPYRSKQRLLKEVQCARVQQIRLEPGQWPLRVFTSPFGGDWQELGDPEMMALAEREGFVRADGFPDVEGMRIWFDHQVPRGTPFVGELIEW